MTSSRPILTSLINDLLLDNANTNTSLNKALTLCKLVKLQWSITRAKREVDDEPSDAKDKRSELNARKLKKEQARKAKLEMRDPSDKPERQTASQKDRGEARLLHDVTALETIHEEGVGLTLLALPNIESLYRCPKVRFLESFAVYEKFGDLNHKTKLESLQGSLLH
jgi:hypothetical protein